MLIAARQAFAAGKRLPYDAEVEYVATDGTQYVDVGFNPGGDTRVVAKFRPGTLPSGNAWFFLSRNAAVAGSGFGLGCNASRFVVSDFNDRRVSDSLQFVSGETYTVDKDRNVCTANGVTLVNESSDFSVAHPLCLCAINSKGVASATLSARMYYVTIYDDGALVRDLVPVRFTNSQGVSEGAMYDRAHPNGGPFGNGLYCGSRPLSFGPDKEEMP